MDGLVRTCSALLSEQKESVGVARAKQAIRDEFMISMNKLLANIKRTLLQLEGELKLSMPDVELPDSVDEVLRNRELRKMVMDTCSQWTTKIRVSASLG